METITLKQDIIDKLKSAFSVSEAEVMDFCRFFSSNIKPEIKTHYLSHLMSSIEELVNKTKKEELLKNIEDSKNTDILLKKPLIRLFTITLKPLPNISGSRKARTYISDFEVAIYYADYLTEQEKRFIIAHELGHIVDKYLLKTEDKSNMENRASLFAYIALLDKDDFYKNHCKDYTYKTDLELYNNYLNIVHNKKCIERVSVKK